MSEALFDRKAYQSFFQSLTGHAPFAYQARVAEVLCSGRNVILRAPTGAGKTWAVVAPYLWKRIQGKGVYDRCIYTLPLRSLASSLHKSVLDACGGLWCGDAIGQCGKDRDYGDSGKLYITIQTGEEQNDPFFEGDLVFTTIDQVLSSYLMMPVSLPERVGNINAGALLGAYLVFDEFHLLEPSRAMGTMIEMADRLSPFSQFLLMTATMSSETLKWLANSLDAEIVTLQKEEVASLPSQRDKKRVIRWVPRPLTAEDIWKAHKKNRTIAILNTVPRAQALYKELKELKERACGSETQLILLHSRFYRQDRVAKESRLSASFGKGAVSMDAILIATQVIEAGMDISADILHTELAPMNSLIQRAGRCARFEGPRGVGTVLVYDLERTVRGERRWGPYREDPLRQIGESTGAVLQGLPTEEKMVNPEQELDWVDRVHSGPESESLGAFSLFQRQRIVNEAMEGQRKDAVSALVRDVFSVGVIVTDSPEALRFDGGMWPRTVAVPRLALYVLKERFQDRRGGQWIAKIPRKVDTEPEEEMRFDWVEGMSVEQAVYAPWLLALSPSVCSYSAELGLQLGVKSGEEVSVEYDVPAPRMRPSMQYEPYRVHVEKVVQQCRQVCLRHRNALVFVERTYHLDQGQAPFLASLTCALHDVGKLSKRWQSPMRKWQAFKDDSRLDAEAIAHTDYDPETDRDLQRKFPSRGPHAAEGAFAVGAWLLETGIREEIASAIWTAIARHHGAHTRELSLFQLIDSAERIVRDTMPWKVQGALPLEDRPDHVSREEFHHDLVCFTREEDYPLWALYTLIVRILRLSDQKSM